MPTKRTEHPAVDKVLLLMVSGIPAADLAAACISKLDVPPDDVQAIIARARRKLTLAAYYNRDQELGTAVTRINDLYARSLRANDIKTALAAQKEMNRLLSLHDASAQQAAKDADPGASGREQAELSAIRGHLLPLGLADASYPLREHARIAADIVRDHQGRQQKG